MDSGKGKGKGVNDGAASSAQPDSVFDETEREFKLDLYAEDYLVDSHGLSSMGGRQPSSMNDGSSLSISSHHLQERRKKLGTVSGVFIPCLQNILGIIFYIRFSWIIGISGIGHGLLLVTLCCLCTFLTGLSLSAIATNGVMKGGGPYYLISRALGPEVGISIGLCFFLGNAIAGSLYILGAVETFLDAVPGARIFKDSTTEIFAQAPTGSSNQTEIVSSPNLHDFQVYGVITTIILCLIVFGGVKIINKVAPAFLVPVLLSILLIFIGIFASPRSKLPSEVTGLRLHTFKKNWGPEYQYTNRAGVPDPDGSIYWNFQALLGLFFPAVTGIMAGSNRSASLKDTQKSIPVGTLSAIASTTILYIVSVFMFGGVATRQELLTNRLLTATVAWPFPAIVEVGVILSTLGAALQSLTGAPSLLSAIANDDILPVLDYFVTTDGGEPYWATLFTAFICAGCAVIGDLDVISPITTMFFLLCYGGVNLSCFLLDLLDAPSWRPRWKFHHWSLSLAGALLCIVIMLLISWAFTIVSLALACLIYYYVCLRGKAGDWGDGVKSAYFQLALRSLRSLGGNPVHPKNWYPIPLVFCKPWGILPSDVPCHPKLADFANCMKKKGRGMSIFVSILEGDYKDKAEEAHHQYRLLTKYIEYKNSEGVAEVVIAKNIRKGFQSVVQTMGLANLKPNIVCMRYPEIWREEKHSYIPDTFIGIINDCSVANKAVVIVKGLDEWPNEYQKQYGPIDLYWIVRDGGLMLLLSQLLRATGIFENCEIRVFCIAEEDAEASDLKSHVKKLIYDIRMQAEVIVVTMKSWETHREDSNAETRFDDECLRRARNRIVTTCGDSEFNSSQSLHHQVDKFLYTSFKVNNIILHYSQMASVVLVSLPPPPPKHPSFCYMEYMDLLVDSIPRLLIVSGYKRDMISIFT